MRDAVSLTAGFYIPFLIATAILLATPGPTILMVISYALAQGRGVALAVVGGVLVGDFLAMTITILGLAAVLAALATMFTVMKWAGAAWLAWMGWKMIRTAGRATADLAEVAARSRATEFRDSSVIALLNPKSIGFFIAFVPQLIDVSAPLGPQLSVMIATFVGLGGLNALAYALLASRLRGLVSRPRVHMWLQCGRDSVLIGLAALTATLRRA